MMLITVCWLAYGCGQKLPATAAVSGKVTVHGKPIAAGRIMFRPEKGRPAIGTIGAGGTYCLTTFRQDDGAVLGKHRVTIEAFEGAPVKHAATFEEEIRGTGTPAPAVRSTVQWIVPEKYAHPDTSPLTAEVKDGKNDVPFDLP
jgi:hypothetical protein